MHSLSIFTPFINYYRIHWFVCREPLHRNSEDIWGASWNCCDPWWTPMLETGLEHTRMLMVKLVFLGEMAFGLTQCNLCFLALQPHVHRWKCSNIWLWGCFGTRLLETVYPTLEALNTERHPGAQHTKHVVWKLCYNMQAMRLNRMMNQNRNHFL